MILLLWYGSKWVVGLQRKKMDNVKAKEKQMHPFSLSLSHSLLLLINRHCNVVVGGGGGGGGGRKRKTSSPSQL